MNTEKSGAVIVPPREVRAAALAPAELVVMPLPNELEPSQILLPAQVIDCLRALAIHSASDFSELESLIPDAVASLQFGNESVALPGHEEQAYDAYFEVARTTGEVRLHGAVAFLSTLRAAALNAREGYTLEPAARANLLRAVRAIAQLYLGDS